MLKEKFTNRKLILASGSPRRQQFLKELGVDFEIRLKEIKEIYPEELKREAITNYLAKLKASAFINELKDDDVLITSDTLVWLNEEALGKPKDSNQAFEILSKLNGQTHQVITSVCLKSTNKEVVFHEITDVTFKKLSTEEICYYIDNYKPFDKAGAYGIQGIGGQFIRRLEGSYTNVMGLDLVVVREELEKLGYRL